jgi:hypothetical protein
MLKRRNLSRNVTVGRRSHTELAKTIIAPSPRATKGVPRQAVVSARGYGDDIAQREHLDGQTAIDGGIVAQLSMIVLAPRHDRAVASKRHGVVQAGGDGTDIR